MKRVQFGSCDVLGMSGGLAETMPVDRFWNLDTIGTYVKSGKIGFTGRTRKVDTLCEQATEGAISLPAMLSSASATALAKGGSAGLPVQFKG